MIELRGRIETGRMLKLRLYRKGNRAVNIWLPPSYHAVVTEVSSDRVRIDDEDERGKEVMETIKLQDDLLEESLRLG